MYNGVCMYGENYITTLRYLLMDNTKIDSLAHFYREQFSTQFNTKWNGYERDY